MNKQKYHITEIERLSKEQYQACRKLPICVVLDNVRSMNNIGSVFRTADAFRLEHIYLCGISATPPHPDIHKTALGSEDNVDWSYTPDTLEVAQTLLHEGYELLALEQARGSITLEDFTPEEGKKYALVLGNEVKGVSQEVVDLSTYCLEIPQFGTKHSLNVSVAGGIALWSLARPLLHLLR